MKPKRPNWWLAYTGVAYVDRGRDPTTGFDCWGFVHAVLPAEFGVAVDDFGEVYPTDIDPGTPAGVA
ncbi:MAG: hypothetical protein ABI740_09905, partial [Alphaproteobacteria bacterium]